MYVQLHWGFLLGVLGLAACHFHHHQTFSHKPTGKTLDHLALYHLPCYMYMYMYIHDMHYIGTQNVPYAILELNVKAELPTFVVV